MKPTSGEVAASLKTLAGPFLEEIEETEAIKGLWPRVTRAERHLRSEKPEEPFRVVLVSARAVYGGVYATK